MMEFGLEEAATCGGQRLLSPTLHSARYGSNDSDEYLEIHYHDDKPVLKTSISSQSSDGNSVKEIEKCEAKLELNRSLSVEPQSPTMDRDCEIDCDSESSNLGSDFVKVESDVGETSNIVSENSTGNPRCDHIDSNDCDKIKKPENNSTKQYTNKTNHLDLHSGILIGEDNFRETKLTKPDTQNNSTNIQNSPIETDQKPKTPLSSDSFQSDPFLNLKSFTQIEAVQTGETIQNVNSVINIEDLAEKCEEFDENEKASPLELSLNLEDLKRSNSIEDIDSPESIQKIDREDCFSWEEDSLLLTIDPVLDLSGDHSQQKPITETTEDKTQLEKEAKNENGDQPIRNVVTNTESIPEMDVKVNNETVTDVSPTKSEKDSPNKKTTALKNKLSTAFGGFNVKEKIRNRKTNNSNKMIPMQDLKDTLPVIPMLQQDECGFPLVIFTKVYIYICIE